MSPWQELLVSVLEDLGSLERQRASWLGAGPRVNDAGELLCQAFDDTGVDDMLGEGLVVIEPHIDARLRALSLDAEHVPSDMGAAELLASGPWIEFSGKARALAQDIRQWLEERGS